MAALVRVPDRSGSHLQRLLDAGADGILVPQVAERRGGAPFGRADGVLAGRAAGDGRTSRAGRWGLATDRRVPGDRRRDRAGHPARGPLPRSTSWTPSSTRPGSTPSSSAWATCRCRPGCRRQPRAAGAHRPPPGRGGRPPAAVWHRGRRCRAAVAGGAARLLVRDGEQRRTIFGRAAAELGGAVRAGLAQRRRRGEACRMTGYESSSSAACRRSPPDALSPPCLSASLTCTIGEPQSASPSSGSPPTGRSARGCSRSDRPACPPHRGRRRPRVPRHARRRAQAAVTFPVDSDEWRRWCNVHIYLMRHGLLLDDLAPGPARRRPRPAAGQLQRPWHDHVRNLMRFNELLAEITGSTDEYGEWMYFLSIFGTPSDDEPWGWQLDGHHLNLHCFVLGDQLVMTPAFLGRGALPRHVRAARRPAGSSRPRSAAGWPWCARSRPTRPAGPSSTRRS